MTIEVDSTSGPGAVEKVVKAFLDHMPTVPQLVTTSVEQHL